MFRIILHFVAVFHTSLKIALLVDTASKLPANLLRRLCNCVTFVRFRG